MRKKSIILVVVMAVCMALFTTAGVFADEAEGENGSVPAEGTQGQEVVTEVPGESEVIPDGWNEDQTQYFVSGEPVTGFFSVDENRYYADENGYVVKGDRFLEVDEQRYILKKGIVLTTPGIVRFNGASYCVGKNGALRSGVAKWKGRYYYFKENYALRQNEGFVYADGLIYFNKKNGGIKTKAFIKWKKKYYYAGKNGVIQTKTFKYKKRKVHPNKKTGAISRYDYMVAIGKYKKSPYKYDKYILIDISSQKLTYYVHGRKKVKCSVVTGCVADGHSTPKGKYRVRRKSRGVTLKGQGYSSYVSYWMPFIGNSYGMHDASWRGSFGGSIYRHNGSHGCVNMPRWAAKKLYKKVSVGTIVIIRK